MDLAEPELELALSAWSGAMRRTAERHVRGQLTTDPVTTTEFLVRWNLRGLGVTAPEIDTAIAVAMRALGEGGFPGTGAPEVRSDIPGSGVEHRP